jgi:hypothetical protein
MATAAGAVDRKFLFILFFLEFLWGALHISESFWDARGLLLLLGPAVGFAFGPLWGALGLRFVHLRD